MKNNFKLDSIKQFIDLEGEDLNENVLRKGYIKESQLKISEDEERTILADVTTQSPDADGDIVIAKGCELDRYLKNPIITINHSYVTEDIVGSAKQIEMLDDRIRFKIKLNDTDKALNLWKQIKAGDIRGNSIGFLIKEAFVKGTKEFDNIAKSLNINKLDGVNRVITKFKLIENSIVALPCNPDALNVEVSKKELIKEDIVEVKEVEVIKEAQLEAQLEVKEEVIVKEEPKHIPTILIINRVGGIDTKKLYDDYKNGKII